MIQVLISGLFLGGVYALLAVGLSMAFGIMGVLNLAHGSLAVLAAILYKKTLVRISISPWALGALVAPLFLGLGCMLHLLLVAPFRRLAAAGQIVASLTASLGVALILEDVFVWWQGWEPISSYFVLPTVTFVGFKIPGLRAAMLGMAALTIGLSTLFLKNTDRGRSMRALAQDREAASLCGINPAITSMTALGLASVLAGLAGIFYSSLYPLGPRDGLNLTLKALFIVVAGGMGNLRGPLRWPALSWDYWKQWAPFFLLTLRPTPSYISCWFHTWSLREVEDGNEGLAEAALCRSLRHFWSCAGCFPGGLPQHFHFYSPD
ncbi:MAG: branched-chain amino acid ABC transporter permease [Proteobacteria bacterium]|nr:branched-chain amino acid ABC transporter permease [Pseudomonadota bacterium]